MANINIGTNRQRINELMGQRAGFLKAAQAALDKGDHLEYKAQLEKAQAMNGQIDDLQAMVQEFDRYDIAHAPVFGTGAKDMEEMGRALAAHERVAFQPKDVLDMMRSNSLLYSGQIVAPSGAGSQVQDGNNAQVSGLINQVRVEDFGGLDSWKEPYLKSIQEAQAGKPATVAGTARTASDPVLKTAKLLPHAIDVTSYVDKNINRLSPVQYAAKIQQYAMIAMLRKATGLTVNGDGLGTHEMFGILNGKNTDDEDIVQKMSGITAIDEDTLRALVFGYGGEEEVTSGARLILNKHHLDAFGKIKIAADDHRKLYKITQNGNTGTIEEGGLIVPYTLSSKMPNANLAYGDPQGYLLGLFGPYTIRVDESVKAVERLLTVLGDAMVGGNLVYDQAFAVVSGLT